MKWLDAIARGNRMTSPTDRVFYLVPPALFMAGPLIVERLASTATAEVGGMIGVVGRHGPLIGLGMYAAWALLMYFKGR